MLNRLFVMSIVEYAFPTILLYTFSAFLQLYEPFYFGGHILVIIVFLLPIGGHAQNRSQKNKQQ